MVESSKTLFYPMNVIHTNVTSPEDCTVLAQISLAKCFVTVVPTNVEGH